MDETFDPAKLIELHIRTVVFDSGYSCNDQIPDFGH